MTSTNSLTRQNSETSADRVHDGAERNGMPESPQHSAGNPAGDGDRTATGINHASSSATDVSRRKSGEFWRKVLHMSPGVLPFVFNWVPHSDPLDWIGLAVVGVLGFILTYTYISQWRVVGRPGEDNFLTTALSYPLIVYAALLLFPAHAEIACVVLVVIALGDGSAFIFGKTLGSRKLPWNREKSWAGMIGFVCVAGPLSSLAWWIEANHPWVTWVQDRSYDPAPVWKAAVVGATASLLGAVAESLPTQISDNLRVGLTALIGAATAHFALLYLV